MGTYYHYYANRNNYNKSCTSVFKGFMQNVT